MYCSIPRIGQINGGVRIPTDPKHVLITIPQRLAPHVVEGETNIIRKTKYPGHFNLAEITRASPTKNIVLKQAWSRDKPLDRCFSAV